MKFQVFVILVTMENATDVLTSLKRMHEITKYMKLQGTTNNSWLHMYVKHSTKNKIKKCNSNA